jgi:transcription-repair coupling factor (superfamily II helicase)
LHERNKSNRNGIVSVILLASMSEVMRKNNYIKIEAAAKEEEMVSKFLQKSWLLYPFQKKHIGGSKIKNKQFFAITRRRILIAFVILFVQSLTQSSNYSNRFFVVVISAFQQHLKYHHKCLLYQKDAANHICNSKANTGILGRRKTSCLYLDISNDDNNNDDEKYQKDAERKRIIQKILDQEDQLIEQERIEESKKEQEQQLVNLKVMSKIAKTVGVTMTTLQRPAAISSFKQSNASSTLEDTLTQKKTKTQTITNSNFKNNNNNDNNNSDNTTKHNNKEVFHAKEQGTLVGSAGGWSLEIFPGDFVVHRKYGIGKFTKTLLVDVQVEEGSPQHVAQQERRKKLIRAAKKAGWQIPKIQKLVSTFGTEADQDLISRPRQTMIEISYQDGLVHVPIDKAYRLSRYQSADVAIPPKLSRVRGGDMTWRKARQKVALMTMEMAQDVLALYATRETLLRTPFDPRKEEQVKLFGNTFPYEPTPDQLSCFETIENDMVWTRRPMDRLICGDVGFGKTEGKKEDEEEEEKRTLKQSHDALMVHF